MIVFFRCLRYRLLTSLGVSYSESFRAQKLHPWLDGTFPHGFQAKESIDWPAKMDGFEIFFGFPPFFFKSFVFGFFGMPA